MKRQSGAMQTPDGALYLAARRRVRSQLLLLLLLCALLGTACITSTAITDVSRKAGGESFIGQTLRLEFNKGVWDSLKPEDRSSMVGAFDSFKAQGWLVGSEEGGRIQTATLDPTSIADLESKGWSVGTTLTDNGKITTVKWLPGGSNSTSDTSGLQSITVTIDESDPQTTRYKYQAVVLVKFEDPPPAAQSPACGDDPWCQMMAQAAATAEADPEYKKMEEALKQAGPPKVIVGVKLPGNIESATINGSPGGNTSGKQVTWEITMNKNATYNLEATASGPGAGSSDPTSFGVTLSCNEDFPDDPGQLICVAVSANAPEDAEIEYEWTFDGAVQGTKGRTLELHDVSKGEHQVEVVAIAVNQNNLRSDPTGMTFNKTTGSDAPTATTTLITDNPPTATATTTTVTGSQGTGVTVITDDTCSRKNETAGVVRIIAVPAGVDKDNIPLTGASAQKIKLKSPFPVYYGQKIQLPSGPGWEIAYIQGPNNRTVIKSPAATFEISCADGIADKITGGVADKWGDASDTATGGGILIEHGINPQEALEFGEGVVGPAIQSQKKENFLNPGLAVMALGALNSFGNPVAALGDYNVAYTVDATDPAVTRISVYRGEVFVLPNNPDLDFIMLSALQSIEVAKDNLSPITTITGSIGNPPIFEDELESQPQAQVQIQGQGGLNIWLLALIGGGLLLLVVVGVFVTTRRKPRPQPAQVSAQMPANPPYAPPMMVAPPPIDPLQAAEQEYGRLRNALAAGQITMQQYQSYVRQLVVKDARGHTWMLGESDGLWYMYDGRSWVRADPRRPG